MYAGSLTLAASRFNARVNAKVMEKQEPHFFFTRYQKRDLLGISKKKKKKTLKPINVLLMFLKAKRLFSSV